MIRCIECGKSMTAISHRKKFCSTKCRNSYRYHGVGSSFPRKADPAEIEEREELKGNTRKQWDSSALTEAMK